MPGPFPFPNLRKGPGIEVVLRKVLNNLIWVDHNVTAVNRACLVNIGIKKMENREMENRGRIFRMFENSNFRFY